MTKLAVSVDEAAEMLSVSRRTAYRLVAAGQLDTVPDLGVTRIPVESVRRFAEAGLAVAS